MASRIGSLVRGPDLDPAVGVDPDQPVIRFHVALVHGRGVERVFDDEISACKAGVHVATSPLVPGEYVGWSIERVGETLVEVDLGVDDDALVSRRLHGVEDRRQRLVIDLDELRRPLGGLLVIGGHRGDLLSDEAHDALRQDGKVLELAAVKRVGDVVPRYHGADARDRTGLGCVYPEDTCVGVRAAQDLCRERLGYGDVGGVDG